MTNRPHCSGLIDAAMATVLAFVRAAVLALAALPAPILGAAAARADSGSATAVLAPVSNAAFADWFGTGHSAGLTPESGREIALGGFADRSRAKADTSSNSRSTTRAFLPLGPISGEFHFSLGEVLFSYSLPGGGPGRSGIAAVQEPTIVLAGYEGQPEISGMACAKRASDEHNLAFRCNAPVAMNVPGGKTSSSRFLTEMEAETGLRLGRDFWAGDPDAGTGARLLTARDVITGMRFTLRYIDERGFTRAANSCADQGRWRWSYVCITDAQWAAKSMVEQCYFVVDEMLSVEGGPVARWTFAPLPAPGTAAGTPIAIGFTLDPLAITDKAALCREVAAQEQISAAVYSFQTAAQADGLALSLLPLTDSETPSVGLSLLIDGDAFVVARLASAPAGTDRADQSCRVSMLWRAAGGKGLCTGFPCTPVATPNL
ncbi:MAG: hypothetical protein VXX87_06865 [Pseudomonadota bacterium]|nr:hypothetical protein [Pseudomonadota bacterium]